MFIEDLKEEMYDVISKEVIKEVLACIINKLLLK